MTSPQYRWKSQKDGFQESLMYMKGRQEGTIKSLLTPWEKFNDAGTAGIEWNTITIIAARPAGGKTVLESQIVREAHDLNPGEDFRILRFQLEMLARTSAIREYSSFTNRSYKYLCSAEGTLTDEDLIACKEYASKVVKYPIDIVDDPVTVGEFVETVEQYMELHMLKDSNGRAMLDPMGRRQYSKTLVSFDHSILLKKSQHERDKMEVLYNFGEALTKLKKKYPIAFLILSQLNRDVEKPERCEDGKYGNYPNNSDIFGSDALLQHADMVIAIDRPALRNIKLYGPQRFIIQDDKTLVLHFLKCRNGDPRKSFFRAEFERMSMAEMPPPPTQQIRTKSS